MKARPPHPPARELLGMDERLRQIRTVTTMGLVVGPLFALFNLWTDGMWALGLSELLAVIFLLVPAAWLGRKAATIALAEFLVLLAAVVILGALIVFGGIEGTGLLWAYIVPFLAFFLKGQRRGWWHCLTFMVLVTMYLVWVHPRLAFSYPYSPVVVTQFLLSLAFYTLLAAAFNQLRSNFEEKLQTRVEEKTADAKRLLSQLQFLALHDPLTSLPNRARLLQWLSQEIALAQTSTHGLVVCNLRLERLFELGNVLGTEGHDSLVRQIAKHLSQATQDKGLLARTGRDEFFLVYRTARGPMTPGTLQPLLPAQQLSLQEQGYQLYIEFTLGLALYPAHADSADALVRKAEQAMLQSRKSGQPWTVYDAQQEQVFVHHHLLFGRLRDAMQRQHLQVHYQPQIELASGRVLGAEALTRWFDPLSGAVSPVLFIPVAEESGLIRPLTRWLIAQALRDCAHWRSQGLALDVSINLCALNLLDPELLSLLQAGLADTGLQPQHINIEITESCFMDSPERAMAVIHSMHDAGFRLAIDDFGTGYSSLSYLKNLPINELKIDQSFVSKLLDSPGDQAIVSSTIDLAHNFGLKVVAEGIEDSATAAWLRARECDIGQGYCYARPMPSNELMAFASAHATRSAVNDVPPGASP